MKYAGGGFNICMAPGLIFDDYAKWHEHYCWQCVGGQSTLLNPISNGVTWGVPYFNPFWDPVTLPSTTFLQYPTQLKRMRTNKWTKTMDNTMKKKQFENTISEILIRSLFLSEH